MTTIVVVSTGGTIAMEQRAAAGGAIPTLRGQDLLSALPLGEIDVAAHEFCNIPSSHMTPALLWDLRETVVGLLRDDDAHGVVVTHGTDTMEETAYLLDLTVTSVKPVVLTGAMRTASEPGYDGGANLAAAIRVAAYPEARELGALVVFNDLIHAARFATKVHTQNPAALASPGWGPLGIVVGDHVSIQKRVPRHILPASGLEPSVLLIRLAMGMESDVLEWAIAQGTRGIVIEALGGGRVPPWWMPAIRSAIARSTAVVIASRCAAGPAYDAYGYPGGYRDLKAAGALFAGGLSGQKARIKLMLALNRPRWEEVATMAEVAAMAFPNGSPQAM